MSERWTVWRHDCIKDGEAPGKPCSPPCDDPWQVDAPTGRVGGTFGTRAAALDWIMSQPTDGPSNREGPRVMA